MFYFDICVSNMEIKQHNIVIWSSKLFFYSVITKVYLVMWKYVNILF